MAVSAEFRAFVLEQLGRVAPVTHRGMFGGVGIYSCPVTPSFTQLGDTKIYAASSSGIRDSSGGSERGVAELAAP
jgi:hypothetical protein